MRKEGREWNRGGGRRRERDGRNWTGVICREMIRWRDSEGGRRRRSREERIRMEYCERRRRGGYDLWSRERRSITRYDCRNCSRSVDRRRETVVV